MAKITVFLFPPRLVAWVLVIGVVTLALTACGPRGETKSVQGIFETAKQRYAGVKLDNLDAAVTGALGKINTNLHELEGQVPATAITEKSYKVADLLASMERHAGYTTRPALNEITTQYRMAALDTSKVNESNMKLLLARTYNLLASELETTRFGVQE